MTVIIKLENEALEEKRENMDRISKTYMTVHYDFNIEEDFNRKLNPNFIYNFIWVVMFIVTFILLFL